MARRPPDGSEDRSSRAASALLVLVVWAAIYLPGLGLHEYKGEEITRALPALSMLDGADPLQPRLYDAPYLAKPPGINALIALSMAASGRRDEVGARLASALSVLALALAFALLPSPWLREEGRRVAALAWLASSGVAQYGRLAEIDAALSAAAGIALLLWLAAWGRGRPGLAWLLASPALLASCLLKGPVALPAVLLPIALLLRARGQLRSLISPAALLAAALVSGPYLAWLLSRPASGLQANELGLGALLLRLIPTEPLDMLETRLGLPLLLLPWAALLPRLWQRQPVEATGDVAAFRALRAGLVAWILVLCLLPGLRRRYALPALPLAVLLLAWQAQAAGLPTWCQRLARAAGLLVFAAAGAWLAVLSTIGSPIWLAILAVAGALLQSARRGRPLAPQEAAVIGAACVAAVLLSLAQLGPTRRAFDKGRPLARALAQACGERPLLLVHPGDPRFGRERFIAYLPRPPRYLHPGQPLPADAFDALLREADLPRLREREHRLLWRLQPPVNGGLLLVRVAASR